MKQTTIAAPARHVAVFDTQHVATIAWSLAVADVASPEARLELRAPVG